MIDLSRISGEELGNLLGLSGRRVRQLAEEGKIPRPDGGKFNGPACVQALLSAARADKPASKLEIEQLRKQAALAEEAEFRTAERRRELISAEEAAAIFDDLVAKVRAEVIGIPARVTRNMEERRRIKGEVNGALSRIADRLRDAKQMARTGVGIPDTAADDDA